MNFKLKYMKYKNKYLNLKYKAGKGKKGKKAAGAGEKPVDMTKWDGPYQSEDLPNRDYYIRKSDKLYALVDKKTGTLTERVIELAEQAKRKKELKEEKKLKNAKKMKAKAERVVAIAKMSESEKEYLGSIKNVEKYQDLLGKIYEKRAIITSELSKKEILVDFVSSGIYFSKVNDSLDNTSFFREPNIKLSADIIHRHIENIHEKDSFEFLLDNVPNFDAKKYLIEWLKDKNFNEKVFLGTTLKNLRNLVEKYVNNLRFLQGKSKKKNKNVALQWFNENIKDLKNISDLKEVNQDMLLEKRAWFESKNFHEKAYNTKTSEKLEILKKEYFDNLKIIQSKSRLAKNDKKWFNKNLKHGFNDELKKELIEAKYNSGVTGKLKVSDGELKMEPIEEKSNSEVTGKLKVSDDESVISEDKILSIKTDIMNKIIDSLELFDVKREILTVELYDLIYENILNYMMFNYFNINPVLEKVLTVNSLVKKIINKIENNKSDKNLAYQFLIDYINIFMRKKYVLMTDDQKKITFNKLKLFNTIIKLSLHTNNKAEVGFEYNHIHVQYLERDNSSNFIVNGEKYKIQFYVIYNFTSNEYNKLDLEEVIDPNKQSHKTRNKYKILLDNKVKDFNREIKECIENNVF